MLPFYTFRPTFDEVKADVMSTKGGLCYTLNFFTKHLLEALGYNVHFTTGSINGPPNNHLLVVISDLTKKGDRHLVDTGSAYPIFTAVSLDFKAETPVFHNSFIQYKYKYEDGKLVQYFKKNSRPPKSEWGARFISDLIERENSFVYEVMDKVYTDTNSKLTPFHKSLRIVASIGPERRAVAFRDAYLLIENESHFLESSYLSSSEEFLEKVNLYFPHLKELAELVLKTGIVQFQID